MKLSVLQENLAKGLATVGRSVASRAQLPVLSNILLTTDKGRLKLSATNLETGINHWLGAKIEKEGTLSVPAKILTEFVSSLPPEKVNLEAKDNNLLVDCGQYQAEFNGLDATEFPKIPSLKSKAEISFATTSLMKAINQVAFAAAQDEGRPVLTGVLLLVRGKELILVATDGYRMSLKKLPTTKGVAESKELKKGLIMPSRTLTELARTVGGTETEKEIGLAITQEANQAIFSSPETEIISRLIEGKYPDFEKIIPEKGKTKIVVDVAELTRAVKVAAIFAREAANIVRFQVDQKGLEITANTAQVGRNIARIEAKVSGEKSKIAFNSRYLLDLLATVDSEEINLELAGALNPGVFTLKNEPSFLHIIMPVRVQE
ncbi:MAG: DNA polymerase III subunit beta [Candidatus Marinimicrobia bacterium]|nr:DNA polymerase III subunit beta [Candidatus Neomarinimicrobiota bacterium]